MISNRLPPFGRVIAAYQEEAIRLEFPLYIFLGKDAAKIAVAQKQWGTLCTYLPQGASFRDYSWPICKQKVVIDSDDEFSETFLKEMVIYLLGFNPRVIVVNTPKFNQVFKGIAHE